MRVWKYTCTRTNQRERVMENDKYIVYINGPWDEPEENEDPVWYNGPGWYFIDETGMLNGPFDTKYDASVTFDVYVEAMG